MYGEIMSKRKTFQITDLNNKRVKQLQRIVRETENTIQQSEIINLGIKILFDGRDQSQLMQILEYEGLI